MTGGHRLPLVPVAALLVAGGGTAATAADCPEPAEEARRQEAFRIYRSGATLLLEEKWSEAEETLRAAIRLDPLLPLAHYGIGQADMALHRYPEAVQAFTASREAFRCASALSSAERIEADKRRDQEVRELREAVRTLEKQRLVAHSIPWKEINKDAPPSLPETSRTIQQLESRIAELERWKRRGYEVPPEVALALGSAHFQSGALADAEREYRAVLQADPKSGDAHNNLAVVCMLTGRLDEAEREVALAEKAGVPVHPRLKEEIRRRKQGP